MQCKRIFIALLILSLNVSTANVYADSLQCNSVSQRYNYEMIMNSLNNLINLLTTSQNKDLIDLSVAASDFLANYKVRKSDIRFLNSHMPVNPEDTGVFSMHSNTIYLSKNGNENSIMVTLVHELTHYMQIKKNNQNSSIDRIALESEAIENSVLFYNEFLGSDLKPGNLQIKEVSKMPAWKQTLALYALYQEKGDNFPFVQMLYSSRSNQPI